MNKKAMSAYHLTMWIIRIMLIATVAIFLGFVIYLLVVNDVGIEHLRTQLFIERALTSSDCFAYYDEQTGRYYGNIIDETRFTEEILSGCIDYGDNKYIAAKLTLTNLESQKVSKLEYDPESFKKWEPFTFDERYYLKEFRQRYVLIATQQGMQKGKLEFEVITPTG